MGLSRNKVAVSEGAAGSPPFYGDHGVLSRGCRSRLTRPEAQTAEYGTFVVQFSEIKDLRKRDPLLQGGVAQLGEHLPCKQGVMGSIPIISTRPEIPVKTMFIENRIKEKE